MDFLVPGLVPLGKGICDHEVIRHFCDDRYYVLTGDAVDRSIPTVRRALEQVEHALKGTRFRVTSTEECSYVFQFLNNITKPRNENLTQRNKAPTVLRHYIDTMPIFQFGSVMVADLAGRYDSL